MSESTQPIQTTISETVTLRIYNVMSEGVITITFDDVAGCADLVPHLPQLVADGFKGLLG